MRQAGRRNGLLLVAGIAYFVDLFLNWEPDGFRTSGLSAWELGIASSTGPIVLALVLVEIVRALGIWRTSVSSLLAFFLSAGVGVLGISALVQMRWGSTYHLKFGDFGYGAWIALPLAIILLVGASGRLREHRRTSRPGEVQSAKVPGRSDQLLLFGGTVYFIDLFLRWLSESDERPVIGYLDGWDVPVASYTGYTVLALVLVETVRRAKVWLTSTSALLAFFLAAGTAILTLASVIDLHWAILSVELGDYGYGAWIAVGLAVVLLGGAFGLLGQRRRAEVGISQERL